MNSGRRAFCAGVGALAVTTASGCPRDRTAPRVPAVGAPAELTVSEHGAGPSHVVEVRWAAAVDAHGRVDAAAVRQMLDAAMRRLTGATGRAAAWAQCAEGSKRLSVKVNSVTSQAFAHPELAAAAAGGLVAEGGDPARVTVWDRDGSSLVARGYALDPAGTKGFRCLGTDGTDGTVDGKRYSATVAGARVHFSPLLMGSDALVNIAALKDHSMAGVTLSLKNNFGVITGADKLHGKVSQGSGCEPGISELAARAEIRDRLRLCILDGLVGVCDGGPGPADPQHVFRYGGILVSRDPVALDRRGLAIIEARRAALRLVPLSARKTPNPSPPRHIDNAAERGVSPT